MTYRSIVGNRFGLGPNGPVYEGTPVGQWPQAWGRGKTYYVDSNRDGGNGDSWDNAAGTLQEVTNRIDQDETAGYNVRGTLVLIAPDHAETITGAGGLTFDVAGVRYVGLGNGSHRPTFLMDGGTSVTAAVSAADVYIENCVFVGGHDGITTCFDVTAAGFTLKNCEFEDNTTAEHFLVAVTANGSADKMTIDGCRWVSIDTGITNFLNLSAIGVDRLTFTNNYMCVDAATGAGLVNSSATAGAAAAVTGIKMAWNTLISGNTANAEMLDAHGTGNTGVVMYNFLGHHDDAATITVDCDGVRMFENRQVSTDTEQGLLDPILAGDT